MKDNIPELVSALSLILPTYYELFVDSSTQTPCITYRESNNKMELGSKELDFNRIEYKIKVWGDVKDYATLRGYCIQIDDSMRAMNLDRNQYDELVMDQQVCLIMGYTILSPENKIQSEVITQ